MKEVLRLSLTKVEEMSRLDYVKQRGWVLPDDEKILAEERVYKVTYEDGYISMCPKEKFDKTGYEIKDNKIPNELVDNFILEKEIETVRIYNKLGTVMKYKLRNGFTGIEHTTCVDEKNYKEEIGAKILENRLKEKIWFGLGFALAMAQGGNNE